MISSKEEKLFCFHQWWMSIPFVPHSHQYSSICGLPLWFRRSRIHLQCRRPGFDPSVGKMPWRGKGYPLQYSGLESSMYYSPWGHRIRHSWMTFTFTLGFHDSLVGKESACKAGDPSSIPGLGRSAGEGMTYPLQCSWASLVVQLVQNLPMVQETWVQSLGWEDPVEKGKAAHSSILAWRIPRTV